MKIISTIVSIITILVLLSTLICGAWIHSQGIADPSSVAFHMQIGIASVILGLASSILLIVQSKKR